MQTFNQSLASLVLRRQISEDLALSMSSSPDELREMLSRGAAGLQSATNAGANRAAARRE
jgi:hypothetical protein